MKSGWVVGRGVYSGGGRLWGLSPPPSKSWGGPGVWNVKEIETTRPALPYDYTCFANGVLHLKKSFKKSSFTCLNVVFYFTILNKTNFYIIKK